MALRKTFIVRSADVVHRLVAFITQNGSPDKPLMVLVSDAEAKHTDEQRALLWSIVRQIAAEAWVGGKQFSPDGWYELLMREYAPRKELELPGGQVIQVRVSINDMGVRALSTLIDEVLAYAATELGVEIKLQA